MDGSAASNAFSHGDSLSEDDDQSGGDRSEVAVFDPKPTRYCVSLSNTRDRHLGFVPSRLLAVGSLGCAFELRRFAGSQRPRVEGSTASDVFSRRGSLEEDDDQSVGDRFGAAVFDAKPNARRRSDAELCIRFAHYDAVGTRTLVDDDRAASSGPVGRTAGEATTRSHKAAETLSTGEPAVDALLVWGKSIKDGHSSATGHGPIKLSPAMPIEIDDLPCRPGTVEPTSFSPVLPGGVPGILDVEVATTAGRAGL